MQFNPDGSMHIPGREEAQAKKAEKMKTQQCIHLTKRVTNFEAPKACLLTIKLSEAITDARFVSTIFNAQKKNARTPMTLTMTDIDEFEVVVGTNFLRCTECTKLVHEFKEHLFGNMIETKGNCPYEGRKNFGYDDHFD